MMIRQHPPARRGFTMIELLVVITIISILLAATLYAVGNAIGVARARATEATILKIDGLLRDRIDAFRVNLEKPAQQRVLQQRIQQLRADPQARVFQDSAIELLVRKDLFRTSFPQTYADNPSLSDPGNYFDGNIQDAVESSEYLYWALTQSDSYGVGSSDASAFSASEVGDVDEDGRQEFVDAWGQPLRFYRWPTRLLRADGPSTTDNDVRNTTRAIAALLIAGLPAGSDPSLLRDPEDTIDRYSAFVSQGLYTAAEFEADYHTPRTYHAPLIVSGGPDRQTGLFEPYDHDTSVPRYGNLAQPTSDLTLLYDNITNHKTQD